MKKQNIISILLAIVMILTMTACVKDNTQAETEHICPVEDLNQNVEDDRDSPILEMTPEEISDYLAEMVHISETETLCRFDMRRIGQNFYDIWRLNNSACDKNEFKAQAIAAFDNIFEQATKQQIPVDYFDTWEYIPITEVLCKYYSSGNFELPEYACLVCTDVLTEEEAIQVAKAYFTNPVFENETYFATSFISEYPDNKATELAWNHIIAASKSTHPKMSVDTTTYFTCLDIFRRHTELLQNKDKMIEIAENILNNPNYNFVEKYVYLCSDFAESDLDKEICDMAYESLLKLAQNPTCEDYELIKQVIAELYKKYDIELPEGDSKDWNLTSLLSEWKKVANTKLPSYY